MTIICPWCSSLITRHETRCPECGYVCNESDIMVHPTQTAGQAEVEALPPRSPSLTLFLASSFCALALSYGLVRMPVSPLPPAVAAVPSLTAPQISQPLQASWLRSANALQAQLHAQDYNGFSNTVALQSPGNLTTFCGRVESTDQTMDLAGARFLSVAGDPAETQIEDHSAGFDTLWTRLCTIASSSW